MFVVSIVDDGQERNLVATKVWMEDGIVVVQAGGKRHAFPASSLIEIMAIEKQYEREDRWDRQRRAIIN